MGFILAREGLSVYVTLFDISTIELSLTQDVSKYILLLLNLSIPELIISISSKLDIIFLSFPISSFFIFKFRKI